MARHAPRGPADFGHPGWHVDPQEPWLLRHWDGRVWSARSRPRPGWMYRALAFEVEEEVVDRSVIEGPAHPDELQAPVARGARSAAWLAPWRPGRSRPGGKQWASPTTPAPASARRPKTTAGTRFGQARRPLVVMASLAAVAAAVVVSSIVMTHPPYDPAGRVQVQGDQPSLSSFAGQATKDCAAALPKYRRALEAEADGPSIAAASHQVDLLRLRLATIPTSRDIAAPVNAWLQYWQDFTGYQRRYAKIIGPALHRNGQEQPSPKAAQQAARQALYEAQRSASTADTYSALLRAPACRLEAQPPRGA